MEYNIERIIKNQKVFKIDTLKEKNITPDDIKYNLTFGIEFTDSNYLAKMNDLNLIMDKLIYEIGDSLESLCPYLIPDFASDQIAIRYIRIIFICSSENDVETLYKKIISFKIKN